MGARHLLLLPGTRSVVSGLQLNSGAEWGKCASIWRSLAATLNARVTAAIAQALSGQPQTVTFVTDATGSPHVHGAHIDTRLS